MIDQQTVLLVLPILLLQLALQIFALVDLFKNDQAAGPKWVWAAIIIFLNFIGPILYFAVGRRKY